MKTIKEYLQKINGRYCSYYLQLFYYHKELTIEQFINTCEEGDLILKVFAEANPNDKNLIILAAAHCANAVRHLMKDQRSLDAVDIAIKFGNNQASKDDLKMYNKNNDNYADAAARALVWAASAVSDAFSVITFASMAVGEEKYREAVLKTYKGEGYYSQDARAACKYKQMAYELDAFCNKDAIAAGEKARVEGNKATKKLTADICRQYLLPNFKRRLKWIKKYKPTKIKWLVILLRQKNWKKKDEVNF